MRIGIISALKSENDLLLKHMEKSALDEKGGRSYFHGNLWGIDTVVSISRMGKVAAAITATQMISDYKPDFILFTGVAGGIKKDLRIGDVVIADALVQHDMDSSPLFNRYEIPLIGVTELIPDHDLTAKVKEVALKFIEEKLHDHLEKETLNEFGINSPKVSLGMIASGDQFLSSKEESLDLAKRLPKVSCVEMEGAAIAQVCYEYNIPFSIIRTISDSANEEAKIDFERFISKVASSYSLGILQEFYASFSEKLQLC